jgi:hypothetical protein
MPGGLTPQSYCLCDKITATVAPGSFVYTVGIPDPNRVGGILMVDYRDNGQGSIELCYQDDIGRECRAPAGTINYLTGDVAIFWAQLPGKDWQGWRTYQSPATSDDAFKAHRRKLIRLSRGEDTAAKFYTAALDALDQLNAHKHHAHMFSHYVRKMPGMILRQTSMYYPNFGIRTTKTGRHNAWVHTLPRDSEPKKAFVSRFGRSPDYPCEGGQQGLIMQGDQSQMELRVLAALADERRMKDMFAAGGDIHRSMAAVVQGKPVDKITKSERQFQKHLNFGIVYGIGDATIADQVGVTEAEAKRYRQALMGQFPGIDRFIQIQQSYVAKHGCVYSPEGFRRLLPDARSDNRRLVSGAYRRAVNTPIQSAASDVTILGLCRVLRRMRAAAYRSFAFNYVHDSGIMDVYPNELLGIMGLMYEEMQLRPAQLHPWLTCPLQVDFELGPSWGELCDVTYLDLVKGVIEFEGGEQKVKATQAILAGWSGYEGNEQFGCRDQQDPGGLWVSRVRFTATMAQAI